MSEPTAERLRLLEGQAVLYADMARHAPVDWTMTKTDCESLSSMLRTGADYGAQLSRLQTAYDAKCAELAAMRAERDEARERLEAIRKDIELPVVEATSEFGPENLEELIACVSKQGKGGNYCLDPDEIVAGRDELRSMCNALRLAWQQRDAARAEAARYHDALVARHGGEPVSLLAELDAARVELAEARRKAIEECIALVAPSDSDVACAEREADDDGFWSIHVQCREECEQHLRALLTKPAQGEGEA